MSFQNLKILKQWNKMLLFDALSNGSTFLGHPVFVENFLRMPVPLSSHKFLEMLLRLILLF